MSPLPQEGMLRHVSSTVAVSGRLRLDGGPAGPRDVPLQVQGRVEYDERVLEAREQPLERRAVRHYHRAAAVLKVGDQEHRPSLSADRRTVVARFDRGEFLIFSPLGPLSPGDLELLETHCDSLLLSCLLPRREVAGGQSWEIPLEPLAGLLGIDVVTESNVRGRLAGTDEGAAEIRIEGEVDGAVQGVLTHVRISGRATFDRKLRMVSRLGIKLEEEREVGHAEPGLDVVADVQVQVRPLDASVPLADERLASLKLDDGPVAVALRFRDSRQRFELSLDRRWTPMLDRHDLCVLRFVDRGEVVAQCNLSLLPARGSGEPMTLEAFQADVRRTLGGQAGQLVEASQAIGDSGNRVLRVLASGAPEGVPIVWIYYHLSDEGGTRAALAFTLEEQQREAFAEADRELVESFRFLESPEAAEAVRRGDERTRS